MDAKSVAMVLSSKPEIPRDIEIIGRNGLVAVMVDRPDKNWLFRPPYAFEKSGCRPHALRSDLFDRISFDREDLARLTANVAIIPPGKQT